MPRSALNVKDGDMGIYILIYAYKDMQRLEHRITLSARTLSPWPQLLMVPRKFQLS